MDKLEDRSIKSIKENKDKPYLYDANTDRNFFQKALIIIQNLECYLGNGAQKSQSLKQLKFKVLQGKFKYKWKNSSFSERKK